MAMHCVEEEVARARRRAALAMPPVALRKRIVFGGGVDIFGWRFGGAV